MKQEELLINRLRQYGQSSVYPFHMPGHKRLAGGGTLGRALDFPNPFEVDITEVAGFDNLHHPEGLLKESMEWAAKVYGADRTYYLVNGSSSGILAGISSAVKYGGRLLMSRNCHKSVYHSVFLRGLEAGYIYPQEIPHLGIQGGILAEDVEKLLKMYPDSQAVMVVSPTYDGIVSDIHSIATVVHRAGLPLIVDEAHGAHFRYDTAFPASAVDCGADLVIQSIHKTLPSLTQTALLHVNRNLEAGGPYVDVKRLERYLQTYQSSSPSYVFMASIENAIFQMERMCGGGSPGGEGCDAGSPGGEAGAAGSPMTRYLDRLRTLRGRLGKLRGLRLVDETLVGRLGVYDLDLSKVVVSTAGTGLTGAQLDQMLRTEYGLEMEMCGADYVTAITSVMDSEEGLERLERALTEIDGRLETAGERAEDVAGRSLPKADIICSISRAMDGETQNVALAESCGCISGEYIYIYPPGIPIVAPGEEISREVLDLVFDYMRQGLPVQGPEDGTMSRIRVVRR